MTIVYTRGIRVEEPTTMALESQRVHKHFRLDGAKIRDVQRVFRVPTETEAIERALEWVLAEHAANLLAAPAHRRFVSGGGAMRDVYGVLDARPQS